MVFDHYLAVEKEDHTTLVCENVDSNQPGFPDPDHYWRNTVESIEEQDIADLGFDTIKMLCWGTPCEDMSLLRLLRKATDTDDDPRPGLKGEKGKVFLRCLQIT